MEISVDYFAQLLGEGEDLNAGQMAARGVIVFVVAIVLIRISGRRSFGIRTPLDNVILILLGAILSRAVVGASPFLPVVVTSFVLVLLHRLLGYWVISRRRLGDVIEGEKILLFEGGAFIYDNLTRALVSEEDVLQGLRESAQAGSLETIDKIYMERNGEISVVKKKGM